jgi:hypothetical protein
VRGNIGVRVIIQTLKSGFKTLKSISVLLLETN